MNSLMKMIHFHWLLLCVFFLPVEGISQAFVAVITPNGGESYKTSTIQSIRWRYQDVTNVKLEFASNFNTSFPGPSVWTTIANSIPAASGSFLWTLPNIPLNIIRIRISNAADSTVYDISDQDFSIYDPVLTPKNIQIVTPNGGEVLDTATRYFNISWISRNVGEIVLQYSTDYGASWLPCDSLFYSGLYYTTYYGSLRSLNWKIPNTLSNNCLIRIMDKTDNSIQDVSDYVFTISKANKKIQVVKPNGDEEYKVNSSNLIKWNSTGLSNIKIEYATAFNLQYPGPNDWKIITTSYPAANGAFSWTVPATPANYVRIKISDANDPNIYDISDQDFRTYDPLLTPKKIKVVTPNGGESLDTATLHFDLSWTAENIGEIIIQYSVDNGSNWIDIDSLRYNGQSWPFLYSTLRSMNWKIPSVVSNQCKLRIIDKQDSTIQDNSDNSFTITAATKKLELKSPNNGNYKANSLLPIKWNSSGISNLKIEYTNMYNYQYPGNNDWIVITPSVSASDTVFNWLVPSQTLWARVRVSDVTNPAIYDISNMDFSVYDPITNPRNVRLITPNGGERLIGKSAYFNISWTSQNLTYLKVQYSIDNGISWLPVDTLIYGIYKLDKAISSYRSMNWPIPPIISDQCRIRIFDEADNSVADECDSRFSIVSTPIVDFIADKTNVSMGQSVTFSDLSNNFPSNWQWHFPGGKPDNSTLQNPIVQYESKGYYDVTLIVSNIYGPDTLVRKKYITVGSTGLSSPQASIGIKIFPNPGKEFMNIEYNSPELITTDITIKNIFGSTLLSKPNQLIQPGKTVMKFNIDTLPSGVYTVTFKFTNGYIIKKLIVE